MRAAARPRRSSHSGQTWLQVFNDVAAGATRTTSWPTSTWRRSLNVPGGRGQPADRPRRHPAVGAVLQHRHSPARGGEAEGTAKRPYHRRSATSSTSYNEGFTGPGHCANDRAVSGPRRVQAYSRTGAGGSSPPLHVSALKGRGVRLRVTRCPRRPPRRRRSSPTATCRRGSRVVRLARSQARPSTVPTSAPSRYTRYPWTAVVARRPQVSSTSCPCRGRDEVRRRGWSRRVGGRRGEAAEEEVRTASSATRSACGPTLPDVSTAATAYW